MPHAREFLVPCLVAILGCGGTGSTSGSSGGIPASGPDPLVLRVPIDGGTVRAFRYPGLDVQVWKASQATPPIDRVLAFDPENGVLAMADAAGSAGWIDLRLGTYRPVGRRRFRSVVSADGWTIYGLSGESTFVRSTPSGDWTFSSARAIRRLIPLPDGTLLVLGGSEGTRLFRLRPPDDAVTDSALVDRADRALVTPVGDRLYLAAGARVMGVPPNDIATRTDWEAGDEVLAMASTPSGDRVFLATRGSQRLQVVNRYSGDIDGSLKLPGFAAELRMDPVGRFLLARPAGGDSAWVVDIGTERLVGSVASAWRADLPAVALDGRVAALRGSDVAFVEPGVGGRTQVITGGADDLWFFTRWNGFRPRAEGIDSPVSFALGEDSASIAADSAPAGAAQEDTARRDAPEGTPAATGGAAPPPVSSTARGWSVSFAAVLSPRRAQEIADSISVEGRRPRIAVTQAEGTSVYRVVIGPFASKDEAERVGRASRRSYWVVEGVP